MQADLLELRKKMQRLLAQDDAYWKQRAKHIGTKTVIETQNCFMVQHLLEKR